MQPAQRAYHILPRPEVQMVRIAEDDLRAGVADLVRMQAAHGSVRTDRHERGRLHDAVRRRERSGSRGALRRGQLEVEHIALRVTAIASP